MGTAERIAIGADGTVRADGREVGRLAVVSLADPQKQGEALFAGRPGPAPAATTIEQGFLEGSGVDPTRAMVDMIISCARSRPASASSARSTTRSAGP